MLSRKTITVGLVGVAVAAGAAVAISTAVTRVPPSSKPASTETVVKTVYTTAYTWYDNTPPRSVAVDYPVLHKTAGGAGTYADPVTIAVGHSLATGKDVLDYPAGTRIYLPDVRRYFIVEDSCGDGNDPQDGPCHQGANVAGSGSTIWLDLWIGGQGATPATMRSCASRITDGNGKLHTAVFNPAPDYVVAPGVGVYHDGTCDVGYGNALVKTAR